LYIEYGGPKELDPTAPVVRIVDSAVVRFHGGVVSQSSAAKLCVNDWSKVTLNNNWCHGKDSKGMKSSGILMTGLTVGAGGISWPVGPSIASASAISPVLGIQHVSGSAKITTMHQPDALSPKNGGCLMLIADGAWSTTTSGNIGNAITATPGTLYQACYDGSKFYLK
jgi:hypothetical protein